MASQCFRCFPPISFWIFIFEECTESCALSALQQSAKSLAAPLSLPAIGDGPEARYSKEDLVLLLELHQKRMNTSERWAIWRWFSLTASCGMDMMNMRMPQA